MHHIRTCLIALICLTSCSPSTTSPADMAIAQARSAVLAKLNTSSAAKLGQLSYLEKTNAVCGSVSASGDPASMEPFFYDVGMAQLSIYDPTENANGKAYDAAQFKQRGCTIGADEADALKPAKALDTTS